MTRASDFWISDRRHDVSLGGMPPAMQLAVLDELEASRARERQLEAALSDGASTWHDRTVEAVAELASHLLAPVEIIAAVPKNIRVGNLARAIDRAIFDAYREAGLIGDHPGIRLHAKLLLMKQRADVRAALEPQSNHPKGDR